MVVQVCTHFGLLPCSKSVCQIPVKAVVCYGRKSVKSE